MVNNLKLTIDNPTNTLIVFSITGLGHNGSRKVVLNMLAIIMNFKF